MRVRRLPLLAALATVSAFAACTLNPQPLPPLDPPESENAAPGGGFGPADGGTRHDDPAPMPSDAGTDPDADSGPPANEGGDAGDAGGDAGDAGDAEVD